MFLITERTKHKRPLYMPVLITLIIPKRTGLPNALVSLHSTDRHTHCSSYLFLISYRAIHAFFNFSVNSGTTSNKSPTSPTSAT